MDPSPIESLIYSAVEGLVKVDTLQVVQPADYQSEWEVIYRKSYVPALGLSSRN